MKHSPKGYSNAYHRSKTTIKARNNKNPNAYRVYYVSPSITRHKPSTAPKAEILADIQGEYTRLHLHYYSTKEEFMKTMSHTAYTTAQKERFYQQYLKRDAIIKSGEYESIRDKKFVFNYLSVLLRRAGEVKDPRLSVISNTLRKYAYTKTEQIAALLTSGKLPDMTRYYIASDEEIFTYQGSESYEAARAALRKVGMDVQTLAEFRKSGSELDESPLMRGADKSQRTRTAKPKSATTRIVSKRTAVKPIIDEVEEYESSGGLMPDSFFTRRDGK